MPEMHLKQYGFTYSACGPFSKKKEIIQNFKQIGYLRYIYKNKLYKADMIWLMEILKIYQKEQLQKSFQRLSF